MYFYSSQTIHIIWIKTCINLLIIYFKQPQNTCIIDLKNIRITMKYAKYKTVIPCSIWQWQVMVLLTMSLMIGLNI